MVRPFAIALEGPVMLVHLLKWSSRSRKGCFPLFRTGILEGEMLFGLLRQVVAFGENV